MYVRMDVHKVWMDVGKISVNTAKTLRKKFWKWNRASLFFFTKRKVCFPSRIRGFWHHHRPSLSPWGIGGNAGWLLWKRLQCNPGLPDVFFKQKNPNLGTFLRALCRLENVDIFYGHLEHFKDIWKFLWPFGTFCVDLSIFSCFGITY
jgi:hypothetical protein